MAEGISRSYARVTVRRGAGARGHFSLERAGGRGRLGPMKNFFASFFGSLLALIVFVGGACLLGFILLAAIAASGDKPVTVEKGSYLVLNMAVNLQDAPEQNEDLADMLEAFGEGGGPRPLQLRAAARAIEAAAADDAISGLFLTGNFRSMNYGSGYAALRELRHGSGRILGALTLRRLSMSRSFLMPAHLLEGLRGQARSGLQIPAGAEMPVRAVKDRHARVVVGLERHKGVEQRVRGGVVHGVAHLGAAQGDQGHVVQFLHLHGFVHHAISPDSLATPYSEQPCE